MTPPAARIALGELASIGGEADHFIASSAPAVGGEADLAPAAPRGAADPITEGIDAALRDVEVSEGQRSISGFFGVVVPPEALHADEELDALLEEAPEETSRTATPTGAAAFDVDDELDALLEEPLPALDEAGAPSFAADRTSVSPAPLRPFVSDALRAIRAGDGAALEQAIRRAVAEGSDLGAVGRLRAVAELARGDLEAARRSLREARASGRDDRAAQARYHLAEALLELHGGDPLMGVRAALAALSASRRDGDGRGEAAALHTLAECYRALGREEQATRIESPHP